MNLPPLALTQTQFEATALKWSGFILRTNQSAKCDTKPTVAMSDADTTVKFDAGRIETHLRNAPNPATKANFEYNCGNDSAPINSASLRFGDYERTVNIRGTESDQVDALAALIDSSLGKYHVAGGSDLRIRLISIYSVLLFLLLFVPSTLRLLKIEQKVGWPYLGVFIAGFILQYYLSSILEFLLPGFAIYAGEDVALYNAIQRPNQLALSALTAYMGGNQSRQITRQASTLTKLSRTPLTEPHLEDAISRRRYESRLSSWWAIRKLGKSDAPPPR